MISIFQNIFCVFCVWLLTFNLSVFIKCLCTVQVSTAVTSTGFVFNSTSMNILIYQFHDFYFFILKYCLKMNLEFSGILCLFFFTVIPWFFHFWLHPLVLTETVLLKLLWHQVEDLVFCSETWPPLLLIGSNPWCF